VCVCVCVCVCVWVCVCVCAYYVSKVQKSEQQLAEKTTKDQSKEKSLQRPI